MPNDTLRLFERLVLFVLTFVLVVAFASPVHSQDGVPYDYVVVERTAEGNLEIVSRQLVVGNYDLNGRSQFGRGEEEIVAQVSDGDGNLVFEQLARAPRFWRGEFAQGFQGEITGQQTLATTAFVLRLPAGTATAADSVLVLQDQTSGRSLSVSGDRLRAATVVPTAEARVARGAAGNPANRLDVLIMGDGYTAAEQGKFTADALNLASTFLGIEPYLSYQNFVNVVTLFTASAESGADHPANCTDGTPDPLAPHFVDTAFDGTYCTSGIHRLLTVNTGKVLTAAAANPDWDEILVVVNDATYGGAGGSLSVVSTHPSAVLVAQHEFGHAYTRLADEYETAYPNFPACSDTSGAACEANVTDVSSIGSLKWDEWLAGSTPVPTPETAQYDEEVGAYEGARYKSSGMFRPKRSCAMRSLGGVFCEVCREAFVTRLYTGAWGTPALGISLIEPGSESPATGTIQREAFAEVEFEIESLTPSHGVAGTWRVEGVPVSAPPGGELFAFVPTTAGNKQVTATLIDNSPMVHAENLPGLSDSVATWTVQVTVGNTLFGVGFSSGDFAPWSRVDD